MIEQIEMRVHLKSFLVGTFEVAVLLLFFICNCMFFVVLFYGEFLFYKNINTWELRS